MPEITGLKLSELQYLNLGSTGTRFYAVTAGSNSYQMTELALYNTLYNLHLSGVFQPKNENWRFVHKTGTESITGSKTFITTLNTFGGLNTTTIQASSLCQFQRTLFNQEMDIFGNLLMYQIDISGLNVIRDTGNTTVADITNRALYEPWRINPIISGLAPSTPTSAGISGQLAISGQKLFIATGTNQWGYININAW